MQKIIVRDCWNMEKEFHSMKELNRFLKQDGMISKYLSKKDIENFNKQNDIKVFLMNINRPKKIEKKYTIIDRQFEYGGGWWTSTQDNPLTKKEVLELFRGYAHDDDIELPKNKKDFNFDFIQDLWQCEIVEHKGA